MTIPGAGGQTPPRPDQHYAGSQGVVVSPGGSQIVRAREVVVSGANGGVFVYSGPAAAGNLKATFTGAAGTDPYGNAYLAGDTSYIVLGTAFAININGVAITYLQAATQAGPYTTVAEIDGPAGNGPVFRPGLEITGQLLLDPDASTPPTPAAGCVLWYQGGSPGILWAKGPSGTASLLANT